MVVVFRGGAPGGAADLARQLSPTAPVLSVRCITTLHSGSSATKIIGIMKTATTDYVSTTSIAIRGDQKIFKQLIYCFAVSVDWLEISKIMNYKYFYCFSASFS